MVTGIFVISNDDSLSLAGDQICAVAVSKKYVFDLEKVKQITIQTSEYGPFLDDMGLAIYLENDTVIFVPSEHRCYTKFLFEEICKVLPIDQMNIVEASSCTEDKSFVLYERPGSCEGLPEESRTGNGLRIFMEEGKLKVSGSIDLGYIGTFTDGQIELDDDLEDIREWDIVEEHFDGEFSDDELIVFLNRYFNDFADNIRQNIGNINGTFLLHVFTDMDSCENDFMMIDELFIEENLLYGNEEDIAEIYNPVREGLYNLAPYISSPNDGSIPKGHIESVLRSFFPMFDLDCFIENIIPEYVGLQDGGISFQCSDGFDESILCGAYAELDEQLCFNDWHNF